MYVFRIAAEIQMPDLPPVRPLHLAGSEDVEVLLKLQSTSCKLPLANGDEFSYAMTPVGDLDDDGVLELVGSAPYRESPICSYTDAGAVCILFVVIKRIDGQDRLQVKSSVAITLETMGAAVEKDSPGILALQQQYSLFGCALLQSATSTVMVHRTWQSQHVELMMVRVQYCFCSYLLQGW